MILSLLCSLTDWISNYMNIACMRYPKIPFFVPWTQTGHGWDVKSVDWHPTKSLLVSGSYSVLLLEFIFPLPAVVIISFLCVEGGKDNLVKLWDAKSGKELCSLWVWLLQLYVLLSKSCYGLLKDYIGSHGHKNMVLCVKWNQNGNWVLTASKDQIIKVGCIFSCVYQP